MEINEALQRIIKHHWLLLAACLLLGLAVPAVLHVARADTYVGTSRLLLGAADPRSGQESNVLADTAFGIASSPGVVAEAVSAARVPRDAREVAAEHVQVDPVGTSGVLELSVTDVDPGVAATLSSALASRVVEHRRAALTGESQRLLDEVNERIQAVTQNLSDIQGAAQQPGASSGALSAREAEALRQREDLAAQRDRIVETLAATPRPDVLDPAGASSEQVPSGLPSRLALGGLLGLLLGVGLSAVREVVRPTLGPEALARHLEAPVLGHLPRRPDQDTLLRDPWLLEHLNLVADEGGVRGVDLVPVGPQVDVSRLAQWLRDDPRAQQDVAVLDLSAPPRNPFGLDRGAGAARPGERGRGRVGLVAVAPVGVDREDLHDLEQHCRLTGMPLLGVITYRAASGGLRRALPDQRRAPLHRRPDSSASSDAAGSEGPRVAAAESP